MQSHTYLLSDGPLCERVLEASLTDVDTTDRPSDSAVNSSDIGCLPLAGLCAFGANRGGLGKAFNLVVGGALWCGFQFHCAVVFTYAMGVWIAGEAGQTTRI